MDSRLLQQVVERVPKFNERIVNGLAVEQLSAIEDYINLIFQCAAVDFPEGLVYEGIEHISPEEAYRRTIDQGSSKHRYEISKSDFYMVAFRLSFNGEELPKVYMELPYVSRGGLLHIQGKQYAIVPALVDPIVNMGQDSLFIKLTRAKLNFSRTPYHVLVNGHQEAMYCVWSWIHSDARKKHNKKDFNSRVIYTTLANYLFAQHGFSQSLKMFANADVVVGTDDITEKNYPVNDWVIISSRGVAPRAIPKKQPYRATALRVAIPKNQYTHMVKTLVGTFFYIADHFPHRIEVDNVNDPWIWKIILGHLIQGPGTSEGLMVNQIEEHITSTVKYIDSIVIRNFKRNGIRIRHLDDLLMYVIDVLSTKTVNSDESIASLYGKQFKTLSYIVEDLEKEINQFLWDISDASKKRPLDTRTIIPRLRKIKHGLLKQRLKNHKNHPEVMPVSASCDNMYFAITQKIVSQERISGGGGKNARINLNDRSKHLHVSVAEGCAYISIPKSDPTGRSHVNPHAPLTSDDKLGRDLSKKELLDNVQRLLSL